MTPVEVAQERRYMQPHRIDRKILEDFAVQEMG